MELIKKMKKWSLGMWGFILICSGPIAFVLLPYDRPPGPLTDDQRAQMMGHGLGTLLPLVVGVVLVVIHLVRRKKGRGESQGGAR